MASVPTVLLAFLGGGVLAIGGAELLVRGASGLAIALGVSPLVVGLTVVAFCTSAPELAVGLQASLVGQDDIAIGNAVGSNIANVLLILGIAAAVKPLVVAQQLVRIDVPIAIAATLLLLLLGQNGRIERLEGGLLLAGAIAYTVFAIAQSRRETQTIRAEYEREYGSATGTYPWVWQSGCVVVGLALLVLGAHWLVGGAVSLARMLGVSELVISLTVVAIGTSLPEIATSVLASWRGDADIGAGNAIGSNITNILLVIGICALASPQGLRFAPAVLRFDLPVALAVIVACLPIFARGYRLARWEGILFLAYYAAYLAYLCLDATHHDMLPTFSAAMGAFVLPLTLVTLGVLYWRDRYRRQREGRG